MASKGLADFLEELSDSGNLARIAVPVNANLEIAEITRRVAAVGGPALLFETVSGQSLGVVTNVLGTVARACLALGVDSLDEVSERLEAAIVANSPQNWFDRLTLGQGDSGLDKLRPKLVKQGPCQQVILLGRDVQLSGFPLVRAWAEESGPRITAGLCLTQGCETLQRGLTRCSLVALDETRLALVDDGDSAFARHLAEHAGAGQKLQIAIVLGGDPALLPLSALSLPDAVDPVHLAGLLRGRPLEVVRCRTHGLEVPADAEIVFEGVCDPAVEKVPVAVDAGDASRLRSVSAPVVLVTAITQRRRAIFPVAIEAGTHGELAVLAKVRERMLLPTLGKLFPAVVDLSLPALGARHAFATVSLAKSYAGQTRQLAAAVWSTQALKFTKFLVLVDADVDVHDGSQIAQAIGTHVDPARDVFSLEGPSYGGDLSLGPLARRMAIDATRKLSSEGPNVSPLPLTAGQEVLRLVTARWSEYGLG